MVPKKCFLKSMAISIYYTVVQSIFILFEPHSLNSYSYFKY
jgi:hypothetical protein